MPHDAKKKCADTKKNRPCTAYSDSFVSDAWAGGLAINQTLHSVLRKLCVHAVKHGGAGGQRSKIDTANHTNTCDQYMPTSQPV